MSREGGGGGGNGGGGGGGQQWVVGSSGGAWGGGGGPGAGYLSAPEMTGGGNGGNNRYSSGYTSGPEGMYRTHHNRIGSGDDQYHYYVQQPPGGGRPGSFYAPGHQQFLPGPPGYNNGGYQPHYQPVGPPGPGYVAYSQESGIGRSQESRTLDPAGRNGDYMRNLEAQRAAECLLSTSAGSSAGNSHSSIPDQVYGQSYQEGGNIYQDSNQQRPPHPQQVRFQPQPYYAHLQHRTIYSGAHSFPVVMTDDLVSGTRPNGKMSPVRRTFLLLCTFDLVFLSFLWLIAILVTGNDLRMEFYAQVIKYSIHSSMFDCILVSLTRFTLCIIFYALLDISHWWVVVVTTVGTVGFLVPKVFEYEWHHDPITYDVSLVLLSFIIAWGEAWFFDFRLVPLETKAKEIWESHGIHHEDERTPLIPPQQGGMLQRYIEGSTLYEGSVANFYSPMESLENSEDEGDGEDGEISEQSGIRIPRRFKRRKTKPFSDQEKHFKKLAENMLQDAWTNLNSQEEWLTTGSIYSKGYYSVSKPYWKYLSYLGWKLEKSLENGDSVQVKVISKKKVFKLTGFVDISGSLLLEDLFYRMEGMPVWNPTVTDCKIIQPIDEYTDVSYQVAAEAAGGVVSTRDFVNLRHWSLINGTFVSAACSVEHPAMPPQPKKVRGENGPTCYALSPVEGDPEKCLFRWLLDTDLKGWIPQSIIDKALSGTQLEFLQLLRQRAKVLLSSEETASSIGSCVDPVETEE